MPVSGSQLSAPKRRSGCTSRWACRIVVAVALTVGCRSGALDTGRARAGHNPAWGVYSWHRAVLLLIGGRGIVTLSGARGAAQRAPENFVSAVTHELKTPWLLKMYLDTLQLRELRSRLESLPHNAGHERLHGHHNQKS